MSRKLRGKRSRRSTVPRRAFRKDAGADGKMPRLPGRMAVPPSGSSAY